MTSKASVWLFFSIMMLTLKTHSQIIEKFTLPVLTSIRAIEVLNDSSVWFAGSNGCFGYTKDNGLTWQIDSFAIAGWKPDFRSMAYINPGTILLLNAGSPARLLKSTDSGQNWSIVYSDDRKEIFFDSMQFWDNQHGIAVGDPINGCFIILLTLDGGDHWSAIDCSVLPDAMPGEAMFAASNTCVDVIGNNIYIGTGGSHARVLYSTDHGKSWEIAATPIQKGGSLTGIFSIDFYDQQNGVVAGGNYEKPNMSLQTKAISDDGGRTWKEISGNVETGFASCIQFQPNAVTKNLLMVTRDGIYFSNRPGKQWKELKDVYGLPAGTGFNTIKFAPGGQVAWCGGADGTIGRIQFK